MRSSPSFEPSPDRPSGQRSALVIATTQYADPELRKLRAPAVDAWALAGVLGDPAIGGFTVTQVIDAGESTMRRAITSFLSSRTVADLAVIYLSCHGVLDKRNRLHFAAIDTLKSDLPGTGVSSVWLMERLEEDCRARAQVLILDCCFSGAFANGVKGDDDLGLERRLPANGRGRAVLTASRASEYSFEGEALPGAAVTGSVFTAGLVAGLRRGDADVDADGYVSVEEAYSYAARYVRSAGAAQTPQHWLSGGEEPIILARNPTRRAVTPAPLPYELAENLVSRHPELRIGAIHVLGGWLTGPDPRYALTATQQLRKAAATDMPAVAATAWKYLAMHGSARPAMPPSSHMERPVNPLTGVPAMSVAPPPARFSRRVTAPAYPARKIAQAAVLDYKSRTYFEKLKLAYGWKASFIEAGWADLRADRAAPSWRTFQSLPDVSRSVVAFNFVISCVVSVLLLNLGHPGWGFAESVILPLWIGTAAPLSFISYQRRALLIGPTRIYAVRGLTPEYIKPVAFRGAAIPWREITRIGPLTDPKGKTYLCAWGTHLTRDPGEPVALCPLGSKHFPSSDIRRAILANHPTANLDPV